jgi:hypothetical protein
MWKTIPRQPRENSSCEKLIKQNARLSVKHALLIVKSSPLLVSVLMALSFGTLSMSAHAEDEPPPPPAPEDFQGAIPDINATTRLLKIIKSSTSRRVYLIDVTKDPAAAQPQSEIQNPPPAEAGEKPAVNKLLLIRTGEENIMALRVLRDITGTTQVIAKKIRQYGDHEALELGQSFYALEKISDVVPPPPTPQDKADMAEVEPAPLAFDPDLDTGSSPFPDGLEDPFGNKEDRLGASIEEKNVPFERHRHWIGVAVGLLRNIPDADQMNGRYYSAGGVRLGYDMGRRIFVSRDDRLDTFTVEGSLFYYSISGLDAGSTSTDTSSSSTTTTAGTDTYTIMPLAATGRYTYYYTENFGIYFYGGIMKNMVMNSQNSSADRVANLGRVIPAVGVGGLLRVGPQWYTRIDVGLDMIGANLMIRF